MSEKTWREIYESLEIVGEQTVPLPMDPALDEFEQTTGFKLPLDYREYIKVFGPGVLCHHFLIVGPGYPMSTYSDEPEFGDLIRLLEIYRDRSRNQLPYSENPDAIRRLIPFVKQIDGKFWAGWDPEDVRDPASHEYGIYFLWSGAEELEPVSVGSFREFIEDYCIGRECLEVAYLGGEQDEATWKSFLPR